MARKIFWTLWMTVWPIVALVPPLVRAQTARQPEPEVVSQSPANSHRHWSPNDSHNVRPDRLASASESRTPLLAGDGGVYIPKHEMAAADSPAAKKTKVTKQQPAAKKVEEPLPPPTTREQPKTPPRPLTANTASPAKPRVSSNSARITEQEELARRLIHERAVLRSLERQSRLEQKYRRMSGQVSSTASTNWQPQTLETNWMLGARRSANP